MGCGHDKDTKNCVCDTLAAVAAAQDMVDNNNGCDASCEIAIGELKGEVLGVTTLFDTIPLLLTCGCEPFMATGALRAMNDNNHKNNMALYDVFQSFLFRVNEVDTDTCCATLELLDIDNGKGDGRGGQGGQGGGKNKFGDFENFIKDLQKADMIVRTRICITVDLNCFCAVTCLPPVATVNL
ncbi:spore coat protein [Bacillus sp. M6-12]|uniref:CotY/CotZ family spore coat protein n=1 Tax=Bacillus sp. M6-12 TaxID=2054166 RepID=UPI000C76F80C|nr:CotY/CotZ family spore coat protein [Bacillus sp. M6-12]PLS16003.1 spore coat protein [Bacillus sp. M6-12]